MKKSTPQVTANNRKWIVLAVITVIAAVILSNFASPHPDGLERVAKYHGFIDKAKPPSGPRGYRITRCRASMCRFSRSASPA